MGGQGHPSNAVCPAYSHPTTHNIRNRMLRCAGLGSRTKQVYYNRRVIFVTTMACMHACMHACMLRHMHEYKHPTPRQKRTASTPILVTTFSRQPSRSVKQGMQKRTRFWNHKSEHLFLEPHRPRSCNLQEEEDAFSEPPVEV